MLAQTEDPAGCLAPYLFPESGLEGELTIHLLGAWYVRRLHPFYREGNEASLRTAAYSWFDSGSSVSLLSRLCGIYHCPEYKQPLQIVAGFYHTCALLEGGMVRCWGIGVNGQLGYANQNHIGDDETPASTGDVNVGGTVVQITAGGYHTCALLEGDAARCWGAGAFGRLGYGNTNNIGDDESPASAGDVDVF